MKQDGQIVDSFALEVDTEKTLNWIGLALHFLGGVLLIWLARRVYAEQLYTAGSDLGYTLGLVGGLLMLSLLLYPLRKRQLLFDERFGAMRHWFRFHVFAGIFGPLLVLFHSTFRTGSLNATAALYAMLLVVGSGILGRFIYRHVSQGLHGKHLELSEATAELESAASSMSTVYALRPDFESRIKSFRSYAFAPDTSPVSHLWKFISLRWRGRRLAGRIRQEAKRELIRRWRKRRESRHELALSYRLARKQIERYIDLVVTASQLAIWERLFSLWHVVHVPFLYLLVFSGIVHVVAVHMY